MRTEDDLRHALSGAAQRAASGSPEARARVGKLVRRQRAGRVGAVAGVAVALAAFGIVTITRPDHRASLRVVSPGPSPSPSAVPGPEPDTASSVPTTAGQGTVPAGFEAASITFVSTKDGFVLGSAPCASRNPCTVILRTTDTGKTWHRINAPSASVVNTEAGASLISRIRFATTNDGWAFGPDLWATHDGGQHWTKTHVDGAVEDLEAAAGTAHYVVLVSGDQGAAHHIASTPIGREEWAYSATVLSQGAAPVADAHLVLQGSAGWILVNERTVYAGARLTQSGWMPWTPPCADVVGSATLMASSPSDLAAVCWEGEWGGNTPPTIHVYFSNNGGKRFDRVATPVRASGLEAASPDANTVVLVSSLNSGFDLLATFDRGQSLSTVFAHTGLERIVDLGFTTPEQGVAIQLDADHHTSRLLLTTDGGHHWKSMPFGPMQTTTRRCKTSDLTLTLGEQVSEATQQRSLALGLTNVSSSECHLFGFPGVSVLSAGGSPLAVEYQRGKDQMVTGNPPSTVELARGASAVVLLNQDGCAGQHYGQGGASIRLIPPDEQTALTVDIPSDNRRLGECEPGDPGNVVHISPVARSLREAVAQP